MTTRLKIEKLIEYMRVKIEERDWHAVSDAANDLRVLEAQEYYEAKTQDDKLSEYAYIQPGFKRA